MNSLVDLLKLSLYAALFTSLYSTTTYAETNSLNPSLFNKLKNTPTLDLANPRLESADYKPLGLALISANPEQKAIILNNSSTAQSSLAKCNFNGVNIELDDQINTREYLFTPDNNCLKLNAYKSKPFWILQYTTNQTPQMVLSTTAYQVRIWKKEAGATKRRIETILNGSALSRYTQKPVEVRCHSAWSFTGSTYTQRTDQSYVEVYRSTPSSSAKSWVVVEGQDPYVALDQNYRCPQ